jgi:hypothetical protein
LMFPGPVSSNILLGEIYYLWNLEYYFWKLSIENRMLSNLTLIGFFKSVSTPL